MQRFFVIGTSLLLFLGLILAGPVGIHSADLPKQEIWYHTGYPGGVVGPKSGMSALMGPTKMPAVFEALWCNRLVEPSQIHTDSADIPGASRPAPPIDLESLRAVHSDHYLKALFTGEPQSLTLSQGLPFWNDSIARGWLLNVGGFYAAAKRALQKKVITANLGHGYHHATVTRGMGFCTINGLAVVANKLIREGKADRVMIIDLDQHEGNGTAECMIGDSRIWNVSIYGSYMGGPPATTNNHVFQVNHGDFSEGLERDMNYLAVISSILPDLILRHDPDVILYQAGMDPYDCAGISKEALSIRDAYVSALSRSMNKPVGWVLAGGYSDITTLVELHMNTLRMANEVLARVKPGDRIGMRIRKPYHWSVQQGVIYFPDWKSFIPGSPRMNMPRPMTEAEAKNLATARERTLKEQRLPEDEIKSAYNTLFKKKYKP